MKVKVGSLHCMLGISLALATVRHRLGLQLSPGLTSLPSAHEKASASTSLTQGWAVLGLSCESSIHIGAQNSSSPSVPTVQGQCV